MSIPSTQPQTLDNTLGAVFLGVVISSILFGVSALQVYYYYHYYPNDSLLYKVSVGLLWILDATHLCLIIGSSYHYGVRGFGHLDGLELVIWPVKLQIAINVVIILLVQSLYAYRVWLLSGYHHGILGYIVAGVVLGGFGVGIVLSYETYTINNWSETGRVAWAAEASFATSTMIDILISVAMCYYLRKSRGKESHLNSRITALIQYTLSCGIFTSAFSVSCLFTFILMPNNLVFLALTYLLTRMYVNSFMAMMNARERVRWQGDSTFMLSNNISSVGLTNSSSRPSHPRSVPDPESPSDKYDWVDVPVPLPSLSSGRTYVPQPLPYEKQAQSYARQW